MNDLTKAKKRIRECQKKQSLQLDLSLCDITHIEEFPDLFKLTQLKSLNISINQISDFSLLQNLTELQYLYINNNQISDISFLQNLTELKTLLLSSNQISDISFLQNLTGLKTLWLDSNKISNISFLQNLTGLQKLYISDNQISDISFLQNLTGIQSLDLSNNKIKEIPLSFFHLKMEIKMKKYSMLNTGLSLYGNPIESPPLEIINQGKDAVLRHFERIAKEGRMDYIYEAKLILVGDGSAGKTSLQKRLVDAEATLPDGDKRTRGIDVIDFEFEKGKIAHIWDFGGQVVYYPVHRFFITEKAVFVLLASTRQPYHNFDYWIPTIFQFGGQSPIIIGQTCHEGLVIPWNDLGVDLNDKHFNIIRTSPKCYCEIDLTNHNKGLDDIKRDIISEIKKLPHFGRGVLKSWATVRKALFEQAKSDACISFESFVLLCRQLEPVYFERMDDIRDCCQFFHDIGVVLWYSEIEGLSDWVILRPEWAMNAVYTIIDNIHDGLIHTHNFEALWNGDSYKDKHPVLKKMLERFKIAFPARHSRNQTYIFPAKLHSIPPEKKWAVTKNALRLEYRFEFMPKGIVNQLSAELSEYIHNRDVWNNAVIFQRESSESQIIEDNYNRKLNITSKGVDARGMNILIMNAIKNVIADYKEVKAEINVPCTCEECIQADKPIYFSYNDLIEKSNKKAKATVTCNRSDHVFKVSTLLYNVGFEIYPSVKREIPYHGTKTITIFLASSAELENDRKEFELFINRENKAYNSKGIFFDLIVWEDFIDCMPPTRLQDEYNKAAISSDIFVSLFWTKTGKYTHEEFDKAYDNFKKHGTPHIFTYFKNEPILPKNIKQDEINSLFDFKNKLSELGHYPTDYKNIEDLKYQFGKQLSKLMESQK